MTNPHNGLRIWLSMRDHDINDSNHATNLHKTAKYLRLSIAHLVKFNADININTPVINKLRASLKARQPKLQPFFNSGAVGLTKNGLVAVRELGAIPLKQRNLVKKLVADENRDRNALYKEIAVANGHPEWASDIQKTFAKVWVQESPSGIWVEDSNGKWKQK